MPADPRDHPGYRGPNFRRLFAEAVQENIIDHFPRELIQPGYFKIRLGRNRPLVAARIYWRDFEPGNEENKLDRWPMPVLAGEILGEYVDPVLVWTGRDRQPLKPPKGYAPENWYRYLVADAKWAREHSPQEPIANPRKPPDFKLLPPAEPPDE